MAAFLSARGPEQEIQRVTVGINAPVKIVVLPSSSVGEESLSLIIQILPADFDAGTSLALNI